MSELTASAAPRDNADDALVRGMLRRDEAAIRTVISNNNRLLFRTARSLLRSDEDAEDVVQETFAKAVIGIEDFRGESLLSTWLTRIAINTALSRRRRQWRVVDMATIDDAVKADGSGWEQSAGIQLPVNPESELSRTEVRQFLERAVDQLPDEFRLVFVLREVEGLSGKDVAEQLGVAEATVRTRLFRARKLLKSAVEAQLASSFASLFPFGGAGCRSMADRVLSGLRDLSPTARDAPPIEVRQ